MASYLDNPELAAAMLTADPRERMERLKRYANKLTARIEEHDRKVQALKLQEEEDEEQEETTTQMFDRVAREAAAKGNNYRAKGGKGLGKVQKRVREEESANE